MKPRGEVALSTIPAGIPTSQAFHCLQGYCRDVLLAFLRRKKDSVICCRFTKKSRPRMKNTRARTQLLPASSFNSQQRQPTNTNTTTHPHTIKTGRHHGAKKTITSSRRTSTAHGGDPGPLARRSQPPRHHSCPCCLPALLPLRPLPFLVLPSTPCGRKKKTAAQCPAHGTYHQRRQPWWWWRRGSRGWRQ